MFEKPLAQLGIRHKLIRPYTPRHNGKVERSHRTDNEYFYADHRFYSFKNFKKRLAVHQRKYNNFPMRPLNWRSPKRLSSLSPICNTSLTNLHAVLPRPAIFGLEFCQNVWYTATEL